MAAEWWEGFFDLDYLRLWRHFNPEKRCEKEADGLWELLDLNSQSRVLDAPCGYGRLSVRLARRGAEVLGVDQSSDLFAQARDEAAAEPDLKLTYLKHDLRWKIPDQSGFDVAINIFSSLGYGSEQDDLEILKTLTQAVRPGGKVFLETNQRDAVVAFLSRNSTPSVRLPDGTLIVEEPHFDQLTGRIQTRWYWSGPGGHGMKDASFRVYSATELVALMERAGLKFVSAHKSCSPEPFEYRQADMGGQIGLLARK